MKRFLCILLLAMLMVLPAASAQNEATLEEEDTVYIYAHVGENTLEIALEKNSSADALLALLAEGDLTVDMSDYGDFEKVGALGVSLPRNDTRITTTPGDFILYQGNSVTLYYDVNSWSFTKLGHIADATRESMLDILGDGDVTVVFSLQKEIVEP